MWAKPSRASPSYNEEARTAGLQEVSLWRYVTSSRFAVDTAENWQSEYLQFTVFIFLTIWLVQRGSSESKKPGDEGRETDKKQLVGRYAREDSPAWARAGGWRTAVYSHSLLITMTAIFAARLVRLRRWRDEWLTTRSGCATSSSR